MQDYKRSLFRLVRRARDVNSKGNTEEKKVAARTPGSEKLAKGDGISGV